MREQMASVDAAWFRMDRPENTADVVSLLTFKQLPPRRHIRRLIEDRLLCWPRFRQLAARGSPFGGDAWELDRRFDLERHLVRRRISSRDPRALRELVSEVCSAQLDPAHPLWRIHLVDGEVGAIVVKIHHALADGFALVALLLGMADDPPAAHPPPHALPAYRRLAPWLDPAGAVRQVLQDPRHALTLGVNGGAIAAALARMAALPSDPPTVLQRPLTGDRRAAWSHGLSLARVREAAHARGGTVNDIIMAAVSGALRGHLAARGERMDGVGLRALVPVNLRPGMPDAGALGNRFGLVFLDLPTDLDTPAARLEAMAARTAVAKQGPDAVASLGVLAALGALPAVGPWATRFFSRKASVVVTNVPGPRSHLHLAGHRIDHAMFWVPHPSTLGVGISVLSYAGEVRIGVRADVAVMQDPMDVVDRFEAELTALGGAPAHRRAG